MDLKEFDLDLPYEPNEESIQSIVKEKNCLRQEATKIDYEINWKEKRRSFRLSTRCISAMFERLFEGIRTKDCWKILVECVDEVKEGRILNFSGVYTTQVVFNYDSFVAADDQQKKKMTLSVLMAGIRSVVESQGWMLEPFETVYSKICNDNYANEWIWKKPVKSADKNYSAEVLCHHSVKFIDIFVVLRDKKGNELAKEKVISELPDEFAYAKHLGELKWISSKEVALLNKKGDNMVSANFELAVKPQPN